MQVISRKDQAQYWHHTEVPYSYVSVDMFSRKFKESSYGKKLDEELSEPYDKSQSHKIALSFSPYSLSKWELFRACASRELLLMKRNSFIYIFKITQVKMICTFVLLYMFPDPFFFLFFFWVRALKQMLILPITILYLLCQRPSKI
jgi:hypothetical protein